VGALILSPSRAGLLLNYENRRETANDFTSSYGLRLPSPPPARTVRSIRGTSRTPRGLPDTLPVTVRTTTLARSATHPFARDRDGWGRLRPLIIPKSKRSSIVRAMLTDEPATALLCCATQEISPEQATARFVSNATVSEAVAAAEVALQSRAFRTSKHITGSRSIVRGVREHTFEIPAWGEDNTRSQSYGRHEMTHISIVVSESVGGTVVKVIPRRSTDGELVALGRREAELARELAVSLRQALDEPVSHCGNTKGSGVSRLENGRTADAGCQSTQWSMWVR